MDQYKENKLLTKYNSILSKLAAINKGASQDFPLSATLCNIHLDLKVTK
jgi:hypothetical protein